MRRLLDQLTQTPAVALGRRMDVLAWNPMAAALYTDIGAVPAARRNHVRLLFTDPVVRGMHAKWEHDARDAIAALRILASWNATQDRQPAPAPRETRTGDRLEPRRTGRAEPRRLTAPYRRPGWVVCLRPN